MNDDEYQDYDEECGDDGYESEEEQTYPEPAPPSLDFPTCAFFVPPANLIEDGSGGGAALPTNYSYDRALPYAACTNRTIVGPEDLGSCVCANYSMPACRGYQAEERTVLEAWTVQYLGDSTDRTMILTRERRGLGYLLFNAAGASSPSEAEARARFVEIRSGASISRQLPPEQPRFLAELTRA